MLLDFFGDIKEILLYRYLILEKEIIIKFKYQDKIDRIEKMENSC